jgi:hypothetical protein
VISREDFIFTIGYEGSTAIVDGRARKEFGGLSTMELAEKGLYRAAFSSALYSGKPGEMKAYIDFFNAKAAPPMGRLHSFRAFSGSISRSEQNLCALTLGVKKKKAGLHTQVAFLRFGIKSRNAMRNSLPAAIQRSSIILHLRYLDSPYPETIDGPYPGFGPR